MTKASARERTAEELAMYFREGAAVPGFRTALGGFSIGAVDQATLATPATCAGYERGEVEKSRTLAGHLAVDVVQHSRGLLIRDFGVDWRHVREQIQNDAVLRQWLATILQIV